MRRLRAALLLVAAFPLAYLLAALVGALVPRNPGWTEPAAGIVVFVRDNGVHTDLLVPARAAGLDLTRLALPAHIENPAYARGWIGFGWGQREFYLETPRWRDLAARNALRAVFGGEALIHVEHDGRPRASTDTRPVILSEGAYRRLVAAIVRSFALEDGRAVPLPGRGYGGYDVFYEAVGRYHAFRTSNQWTADVLAAAGVRVGVWTPFAAGVMWRLEIQHRIPVERGRMDS